MPMESIKYEVRMKKVEIYTKSYCPYCRKAKQLLQQYDYSLVEYDVEHDQEKYQEMLERSERKTVPQIFIDGKHIGGCDDLFAYKEQGKL